ncbi:hypothetical protein [Qipengyuania sediminis]|uniref:hypothetical protein n=1 Tax=Qipengyuania sediminis TaxID=1532023 RepID=UPI00105AADF0|nr:hypothetical protein [Qipengyuania sediminis]
MGEYEPDDSRDVTLSDHQAPGEPPRTGPREDEARAKAAGGQAGTQMSGQDGAIPDATGGRPVDEAALAKDAEDAARAQPSQDRTGGS